MGTTLAMSFGFHSQTDGQTKRASRTIEEMLRAYVGKRQNIGMKDWVLWNLHTTMLCTVRQDYVLLFVLWATSCESNKSVDPS